MSCQHGAVTTRLSWIPTGQDRPGSRGIIIHPWLSDSRPVHLRWICLGKFSRQSENGFHEGHQRTAQALRMFSDPVRMWPLLLLPGLILLARCLSPQAFTPLSFPAGRTPAGPPCTIQATHHLHRSVHAGEAGPSIPPLIFRPFSVSHFIFSLLFLLSPKSCTYTPSWFAEKVLATASFPGRGAHRLSLLFSPRPGALHPGALSALRPVPVSGPTNFFCLGPRTFKSILKLEKRQAESVEESPGDAGVVSGV